MAKKTHMEEDRPVKVTKCFPEEVATGTRLQGEEDLAGRVGMGGIPGMAAS